MKRTVLITDYAWKDLAEEHAILSEAGAELVAAPTGEEHEVVEMAREADGILTCWKRVSGAAIQNAPKCQVIGRLGVGLDNIDVETATRCGILVTNVPDYCVDEVSDHAMALLLACARKIAVYDRLIRDGVYELKAGTPIYRVRGKTLGIVGLGRIGRSVGRKALAFGMNVLSYDPQLPPGIAEQAGAKPVSFEELLAASDFISLHAPLAPATQGLFNAAAFQRMKPTAYLINASRGGLIDHAALLSALAAGQLAGAALDVLAAEPPSPSDPVLHHPKIIVTPHVAFYSEESLIDLRRTAARQVADTLWGKEPKSIVNPQVLGQSNLRAAFRRTPA